MVVLCLRYNQPSKRGCQRSTYIYKLNREVQPFGTSEYICIHVFVSLSVLISVSVSNV